jgi:hypothetical protein
MGGAWGEFSSVREAAAFLVLSHKGSKSLADITRSVCPTLSLNHLHHIAAAAFDDKHGGAPVTKLVS